MNSKEMAEEIDNLQHTVDSQESVSLNQPTHSTTEYQTAYRG